ncbi:gliding motility-associated C-terminal domain-containing protein [Saccharicrinis carchari]|uniref:Gliding motility-associated C-terminal domain-containing protein n=1 Tax=Saccharicrinis carchari TaxID=1168039 RepID=A0A521AS59_SACCC|nr:PKD domain-containing protein [Saccharicrinis carchari]SMO37601.1 gliding motility-associated C-terminal domain-containing protein [Saccharicrinis carchari]
MNKHLRFFSFHFIVIFSFIHVNSQVVVNFTSKTQEGCVPLQVNFVNKTPNEGNLTYLWDFGDGNTSTEPNPHYTYTSVGRYTVSLTVTDGDNSQSLTKENFIHIYDAPVVSFTPDSPTEQCAPFDIHFISHISSTTTNDNYLWDFGDGIFSTDPNPVHTFQQPGIYSVTLIYTDKNGCISKTSIDELIIAKKPTAIFEVKERFSCKGILNTQFNNQSYGIGDLSYKWDFGDQQFSHQQSPAHQYTQAGSYDVSLTVTDDLGCSDSIVFKELIEVSNTLAGFTLIADTVCPNTPVLFTNTSINNRINKWDFGDGKNSTEINPSHIYTQPGDYVVELVIENYECTSRTTALIHVEEVKADFTISDSFACQVPVDITYNATGDPMESYNWIFGKDETSDQKTPMHTYTSSEELSKHKKQNHTTTLIVTSKHGCKAKVVKKDVLQIVLPQVKITSDRPTSGCTPIDIKFDHTITYDTPLDHISGITWKTDKGDPSTEDAFHYTYNEVGKYNVYLSATTERGCTANSSITISAGQKVEADFKVKDKNIFCASEAVEFIDITNNAPLFDDIVWDFGDGMKSEMGIPMHHYTDTGYMDVKLQVTHNGCISSTKKDKAVYIKGPIAKYSRIQNCDSPYTADFTIDLIDADSYTCYFDDGDSIVNAGTNFSHTYTQKGIYAVVLKAHKAGSTCSFSYHNNILISDPQAVFDTTGTGPCANTALRFDASQSSDAASFDFNGMYKKYLWDFGDNTTVEFSDDPIVHKYKHKGTFVAQLVVKDRNNCTDTLRKEIKIFNPLSKFTNDYVDGCMPVKYQFNNLSEHELPITRWEWDFGDGTTSNQENPTHEYQAFGNYNVRLSLTNEKGCTSSMLLKNEIKVIDPHAAFTVSKLNACINDTLLFWDRSKSNVSDFLWDFGDGNQSTLRNPKHVYSHPGIYDVSLTITDHHGCELKHTEPSYINTEAPPVAQFTSNQQESNCYPFPVLFSNETNYSKPGTQKWMFGDNLDGSTLSKPQHIYTKPGNYQVSLIAYSANGCADTLTKADFIRVKGPYAEIALPDTACFNSELTFGVKNENNLSSVVWDFRDGSISTDLESKHRYKQSGYLYPLLLLKSDSKFECNKIITDTIFIREQVKAKFIYPDDNNSGCIPFNMRVINQSENAVNYQWQSGNGMESNEASPSFVYKTNGTYPLKLVAKDSFGCSDTLVDAITAHPLPTITTSPDTFICVGNNLLLQAYGGIAYRWDHSPYLDDLNIDAPIANPVKNTTFRVSVTDQNSCVNKDSVRVTVQQIPVLEPIDTTIIIGETVQLNLYRNNIKTYTWEDAPGISCTNCPNPILSPLNSTEYMVSVTDTSNCFTEVYKAKVKVEKKYSVDVPTAFTPNNDNINDIIYVKGWGLKKLVYFRVFNRLGQIVFETDNLKKGWDGKFKGNPQIADTYNYVVKVVTYNDDMLEKKGSFNLLR